MLLEAGFRDIGLTARLVDHTIVTFELTLKQVTVAAAVSPEKSPPAEIDLLFHVRWDSSRIKWAVEDSK